MEFATANGIEIAYERIGSGPPIVLSHGGEGDHRNFYNFAPLLAQRFTVISYDQRDTGETRNGVADYMLPDLGRDLAALIEALGYDRAHVFGTSYGGVIAQHAAIERPERIDHLVLSCTWPGGEKHVSDEFLALALRPKEGDEVKEYWKNFFGAAFLRAHPEEVVPRMQKVITTRTTEQRTRRGKGAFSHDARAQLPSVRNPTLVIAAAEDKILLPDQPRKLAALIPNSRFVLLKGVGHACTIETPERVAKEIFDFIPA